MKYISAKEAAERWQISPCRVAILANSGRIQGVVRMGKSWMIPENARKPEDARTRLARERKREDEYRFPLPYAYADAYRGGRVYQAWVLTEQGRFEEADALLRDVLETTENKYERIGALTICVENSLSRGDFARCSASMTELKMILAEDDPYKAELSFILYEMISLYDGVCEFEYDTTYPYSEECIPYIVCLDAYRSVVDSLKSEKPYNTLALEQYCRSLEEKRCLFYAMYLHCYIAMLYIRKDDRRAIRHHLKMAIDEAIQCGKYASLARLTAYFKPYFGEVLQEYPKEVVRTLEGLAESLRKSYADFLIYQGKTKLFSVLNAEDYRYMMYVLRDCTIREIAVRENKSENAINKYLSRLYAKLGVDGKKEMKERYINTFFNKGGDSQMT